MQKVLADPAQARAQMDVLVNGAADIVRTLEADGSPGRAPLVAAFDAALVRLEADASLSRADRLEALTSRVRLARLDLQKDSVQVKLPDPALKLINNETGQYFHPTDAVPVTVTSRCVATSSRIVLSSSSRPTSGMGGSGGAAAMAGRACEGSYAEPSTSGSVKR